MKLNFVCTEIFVYISPTLVANLYINRKVFTSYEYYSIESLKPKKVFFFNLVKVSVISLGYVYFLFIYFILLIDVFFDKDSKFTIGFRRSHLVFEL